MSVWLAIMMPVAGSLVLLLLFWFVGGLYYVLLALFTVASIASLTFTFHPVFDASCSHLFPSYSIHVRWKTWLDEDLPVATIVSLAFSVSFVGIWLLLRSFLYGWIVTNALALCLVVAALSVLRLPNLLVSTALLGLFFLYDIFWVFLSPYIFGKSVMVSVATQVGPSLPMVLFFPRILTEGTALLGVGDMVTAY